MKLSFDAWKPGAVAPATVEVPIYQPEVVESSQLRATLKGPEESISQLVWSPDGKVLASVTGQTGEVRLWDAAQGRELMKFQAEQGNYACLAFAPDGKTLAVGSYKRGEKGELTGGIGFWDVATGKAVRQLAHKAPRAVTRLAFSPDGKTLAASEAWREGDNADYVRAITLWDVAGGTVRATIREAYPLGIAFSPDGAVLALAVAKIKDNRMEGSEVRRRDLTTGKDLPPLTLAVTKNPLYLIAFSPDGRTLAGADYEGTLVLWDTAKAEIRATVRGETKRRCAALAFAPDGKTLALGLGDPPGREHEPGQIVLYDAGSGKQRGVLTGHKSAVLAVAFSPDGKLLASGGQDQTIRLWDVSPAPAARDSGRR